MFVYLVITPTSPAPPAVESAVAKLFRDNFYKHSPHSWFVASKKTAKAISDELGFTEGKVGTGIVMALGDYYGRANRDMWAWIKTKLEAEE